MKNWLKFATAFLFWAFLQPMSAAPAPTVWPTLSAIPCTSDAMCSGSYHDVSVLASTTFGAAGLVQYSWHAVGDGLCAGGYYRPGGTTGCFVPAQVGANALKGLGAGNAAMLAIAPGTAGGPVVNGGAGGTPSSLTLTHATGLPASGISDLLSGSAAVSGIPVFASSGGVFSDSGVALQAFIGNLPASPAWNLLLTVNGKPTLNPNSWSNFILGIYPYPICTLSGGSACTQNVMLGQCAEHTQGGNSLTCVGIGALENDYAGLRLQSFGDDSCGDEIDASYGNCYGYRAGDGLATSQAGLSNHYGFLYHGSWFTFHGQYNGITQSLATQAASPPTEFSVYGNNCLLGLGDSTNVSNMGIFCGSSTHWGFGGVGQYDTNGTNIMPDATVTVMQTGSGSNTQLHIKANPNKASAAVMLGKFDNPDAGGAAIFQAVSDAANFSMYAFGSTCVLSACSASSGDANYKGNAEIYAGSATPRFSIVAGKSDGSIGVYTGSEAAANLRALFSSSGLQVPSLKSTTGTRYVCVDTNGSLVSSATACSGT